VLLAVIGADPPEPEGNLRQDHLPPQGVRSVRKNAYTAVARVEAPDASTVVFKLKFPSASLLANLASPWNVIFPKKYLDQDPNYFKTHVMGSGPFKFKNYARGSTFEGEPNPDDVDLADVLAPLGARAGFRVRTSASLGRVTATFTAVSVEQALRRLVQDHELMLIHSPASDASVPPAGPSERPRASPSTCA